MYTGYVLLNCDLGSEEYVIEELKQIPEIKTCHLTFGAYDIIAEICVETQEDFDSIVADKIRKLSRVLSTMTLNVIDNK
jgi:DNA-binding Lrp family transcriptional regulator